MELVGRHDLDDEAFVDDHVDPLPPELLALVVDDDIHFSADSMAARPQLTLERVLVEVLEEAAAEGVVDLVEGRR